MDMDVDMSMDVDIDMEVEKYTFLSTSNEKTLSVVDEATIS
jgi:hypothetical protein